MKKFIAIWLCSMLVFSSTLVFIEVSEDAEGEVIENLVDQTTAEGRLNNGIELKSATGINGKDSLDSDHDLSNTPVKASETTSLNSEATFTIASSTMPINPLNISGKVTLYNGSLTTGYNPLRIFNADVIVETQNISGWWTTLTDTTDGAGNYEVTFQPNNYIDGGTVYVNITTLGNILANNTLAPFTSTAFLTPGWRNYTTDIAVDSAGQQFINATLGIPYNLTTTWVPDYLTTPIPIVNMLVPGSIFYVNASIYDEWGNVTPGYYGTVQALTDEIHPSAIIWGNPVMTWAVEFNGLGGPTSPATGGAFSTNDGYNNMTCLFWTAGIQVIWTNDTTTPLNSLTPDVPAGNPAPYKQAFSESDNTHVRIYAGGFHWQPLAGWNIISIPKNTTYTPFHAQHAINATILAAARYGIPFLEVSFSMRLPGSPATYSSLTYIGPTALPALGIGVIFPMGIDLAYWMYLDVAIPYVYVQGSELDIGWGDISAAGVNTVNLVAGWNMVNAGLNAISQVFSTAAVPGFYAPAVVDIEGNVGNTSSPSNGTILYTGGGWISGSYYGWYDQPMGPFNRWDAQNANPGMYVNALGLLTLATIWNPATQMYQSNVYDDWYGLWNNGDGFANEGLPIYYASGFLIYSESSCSITYSINDGGAKAEVQSSNESKNENTNQTDPDPPETTITSITPDPYMGQLPTQATLIVFGDDSANGSSNVTGAEYRFDRNMNGVWDGTELWTPMTATEPLGMFRNFTATIDLHNATMGVPAVNNIEARASDGNWDLTPAFIIYDVLDFTPPLVTFNQPPTPADGSTVPVGTYMISVDVEDFQDTHVVGTVLITAWNTKGIKTLADQPMTFVGWALGSNICTFEFPITEDSGGTVTYWVNATIGPTSSNNLRTFDTVEDMRPMDPYTIYGSVYLYNGSLGFGYLPLTISNADVTVAAQNISGGWTTIVTTTDSAGNYLVTFQPEEYLDGATIWVNVTTPGNVLVSTPWPPFTSTAFSAPGWQNYTTGIVMESAGKQLINATLGIPYNLTTTWVPDYLTTPIPNVNMLTPGQMFWVNATVTDYWGNIAPGYYGICQAQTDEIHPSATIWGNPVMTWAVEFNGLGGPTSPATGGVFSTSDGYNNMTCTFWTAGTWAIWTNDTTTPLNRLTPNIPVFSPAPQCPAFRVWNMTHVSISGPAIITVGKVVDLATALPGDYLTYTLNFNNTGAATASWVWINDTLPIGVVYVSDNASAIPYFFDRVIAGNLLMYRFVNVPTGPHSFNIIVRIRNSTPFCTWLNNTVTCDFNPDGYTTSDYALTHVIRPVINIAKVADKTTAYPGEQVTYTIFFNNTDTAPATYVWINDTLPNGVIYISDSADTSPTSAPYYDSSGVSGQNLYFNFTDVTAGPHSFDITVQLAGNLTEGQILENWVTIDYTQSNGINWGPYQTVARIIVIGGPLVEITKVVSQPSANTGEMITYRIFFNNTGNGNATYVWVNDTLPLGVTYMSDTAATSPTTAPFYDSSGISGPNLWFNFTDLTPGPHSFVIDVLITNDSDGAVLINWVSCNYTSITGVHGPETIDSAVVIVSRPVIVVEKTVDRAKTVPTDILTYTIWHNNTGSYQADVWINDTIPDGTTYLASSLGVPDAINGRRYTWHVGIIPPFSVNAAWILVQVNATTPSGTYLNNTVELNYTCPASGYEFAGSVAEATSMVSVMAIEKTVDLAVANPGDMLIYTIWFNNTGSVNADHVWVNDTLPSWVNVVSGPTSSIPWFSMTIVGNDYYFYYTDLPVGLHNITFVVSINPAIPDNTNITNYVTCEFEMANGFERTSSANATTWVLCATIVVEKSVDRTIAYPGDILTYTIWFNNTGYGNAAYVWINDTMPMGVIYISDTAMGNPYFVGKDTTGNPLLFEFQNVPPGVHSFTITVFIDTNVSDNTTLTNWVVCEYELANGQGWMSQDWAATLIIRPNISVVKTVNTAEANPGDLLVYTIYFNNTGAGTANAVNITDILPNWVMFIGHTAGSVVGAVFVPPEGFSGQYLWFNFSDVQPGEHSFTITVQVWGTTPDCPILENIVICEYGLQNGVAFEMTSDNATTHINRPVITVNKTVDYSVASPGFYLNYTITFTNSGSGTASFVWINDTLPNGVVYINDTADLIIPYFVPPTGQSGQRLYFNFTNVLGFSSFSFQITVWIDTAYGHMPGDQLWNWVFCNYTAPNGQSWESNDNAITLIETIDTTPPTHSNESPAIDGWTNDPTPVISVHVTDPSGVEVSSVRLYIDGFMVFYDLEIITDGYNVSYWHMGGFSDGQVVECRIVADDMFGNHLDFTWYFTVDLTAPWIVWTDPWDDQDGVSLDNNITVGFSEAMNGYWTELAFYITPPMNGTFCWVGNKTTMIFEPSELLQLNTTYTVTISVLARDLAGNCLSANYTWNFTTSNVDIFPPEHSNEFPAIDGYTVNLYPTISVHVIDISGVNTSTIKFYINGYRVFHSLADVPNGYNVSYWHEGGFSWGEVVTCRIIADDVYGNTLDFTWDFTVLQTFEISLSMGWNLISFPLVQGNTSILSVLSSIDGQWDLVQYYNASDTADHWKMYATFMPPSLNDLWMLDHTMGFWLHTTEVCNLTVHGMVPVSTQIPLFAGWNLVGYPSLTEKSISDALAGTGYDRVEGFNATAPYLLSPLDDSYMMKPGEGYWVHVPVDTVWIVDW